MTPPMPVEIVRPRRARADVIASIVGNFGEWFLSAWALMVLLPDFTSWHPSYGRALALVVAVRVALPVDTAWLKWTRASVAKRGVR